MPQVDSQAKKTKNMILQYQGINEHFLITYKKITLGNDLTCFQTVRTSWEGSLPGDEPSNMDIEMYQALHVHSAVLY